MTKKKAVHIPDKIDKVITLLPTSKSKRDAFIKAGYSVKTATTRHTALNRRIENRLLQYEKSGLPIDPYFNIENLLKEYEKICLQDKDNSSKLKAINGVFSKYGNSIVNTNTNDTQNTQPILNITVRNVQELPKNEPVRIQAEIVQDEPISP